MPSDDDLSFITDPVTVEGINLLVSIGVGNARGFDEAPLTDAEKVLFVLLYPYHKCVLGMGKANTIRYLINKRLMELEFEGLGNDGE